MTEFLAPTADCGAGLPCLAPLVICCRVLQCYRLLVLTELIPLSSHFSQIQQELHAWLGDITTDVKSLDSTPGDLTPDTDDHAEQLRMRRYNVKVPAW